MNKNETFGTEKSVFDIVKIKSSGKDELTIKRQEHKSKNFVRRNFETLVLDSGLTGAEILIKGRSK